MPSMPAIYVPQSSWLGRVLNMIPQWCFVLNCLHFENKENKQNGVKVLYQFRYKSEVHGLSFPVTGDMLVGLQSDVQTVEQALING